VIGANLHVNGEVRSGEDAESILDRRRKIFMDASDVACYRTERPDVTPGFKEVQGWIPRRPQAMRHCRLMRDGKRFFGSGIEQ
jgi:hypothetical protein